LRLEPLDTKFLEMFSEPYNHKLFRYLRCCHYNNYKDEIPTKTFVLVDIRYECSEHI
jgi:hypothetical protein